MKRSCLLGSLLLAGIGFAAPVPPAVPDALTGPRLRDVRLKSAPGRKLDDFAQARMRSDFAQREIFGEARSAFERRDDDARKVDGKAPGGLWRGEFWGKLMLGTARTADYLQDPALLAFVKDECHRLMALQDADGYLGSYADKELVGVLTPEQKKAAAKAYGWNTVWNIWNRKYAMWGMLAAYRTTGDRAILDSVVRQMDQLIGMMRRLNLPFFVTGQPEKVGLPSMSILKPLLGLYAETGDAKYLAVAKEIVADWDRDDGACPNFFRNAQNGKDLWTWYPNAQLWAKTYEMLSCLDGLLEYYRVTGDRRSLDTVVAIRDNLWKSEANPFGGIGYCDQCYGAARRINGVSEVCDAIHWIRLNVDLFLITGESRFLDTVEVCYYNNFLAGVYRGGQWGAFAVRSHVRHQTQWQCGCAYNHCCVNNVPRTFMDVAATTVTKDRKGVYQVNFYSDATVEMDGVRFEISGDYPIGDVVTVRVSKSDAPVAFRKPDACRKMETSFRDEGDARVYTVKFDMPVRIVERPLPPDPLADEPWGWIRARYATDGNKTVNQDVSASFRTTAAAMVWRGPLLLAKAKRAGATADQIATPDTVNGRGFDVKATPLAREGVWGAWRLEFAKPGEKPFVVDACDFQSAADDPLPEGANEFSIWF